jgi:mRNA-degrading endonuclease RelE of RelBE toxin-antitoxin system
MAVVSITSEAQAQFHGLPKVIRARIEHLFVRLQAWPDVSGAKPLRGALAGHYRLRTGDYRIQFHVEAGDAKARPPKPDIVWIERIGHRDGFYEEK